jgi:hypothetical protein
MWDAAGREALAAEAARFAAFLGRSLRLTVTG